MNKRLESVPEEKEADPEPLPTPPSQVQQEDQASFPTEDQASLPPLKSQSKPSVEAILKQMKPQVNHCHLSKNKSLSCSNQPMNLNFRKKNERITPLLLRGRQLWVDV